MSAVPTSAELIETPLDEAGLLQFAALLDRPRLIHAVTLAPWNLAPHRGPDADHAVARRKRLCDHLGISFDRLTAPQQVHGPEVVPVGPEDIGAGRFGRDDAVKFVDGLLTDQPDVGLLILAADCTLVLVYDPVRPAVGAVHASWRCTLPDITGHLVRTMQRRYGSDPRNMIAAVAPSAGPCCYEVGRDLVRVAEQRFDHPQRYLPHADGRTTLDLWQANVDQLASAGLQPENILRADLCTICDPRFFSHRRQGPGTGRHALLVAIKP